jgi:hypothetical protein
MLWDGRQVAFYYWKEKEKTKVPHAFLLGLMWAAAIFFLKRVIWDMRLQIIEGSSCACLWSRKLEQAYPRSCSFLAHENHWTNSTGRSSQSPPNPPLWMCCSLFTCKYFFVLDLFSFVLGKKKKGAPKKILTKWPQKNSQIFFCNA